MAGTGWVAYKGSWKVASTFIGTIIGAGFASGQEILKFFSHFGPGGILGIVLSCVLFCITGTATMFLGRKLEAASFGDVIRYTCGQRLGPVMDLLLGIFLFGTLSIMLAGSGAIFFQQWGLPYWLGTGFTLLVSLVTVFFGIKGILHANCVVVPVMITVCILATLPAALSEGTAARLHDFTPAGSGAAGHWLLSALLYVSYNITLGVSVLAPLGREIKNPRALLCGGILGGLGLGILAMFINLAILSNYPESAQYEVPSLFVAGRLASTIQLTFSFVLWAEVFTTIIGDVYGLALRVSALTGLGYPTVVVILMVAALLLSGLGFSGLVGFLYPLFGYVSLVFLVSLLTLPLFRRR